MQKRLRARLSVEIETEDKSQYQRVELELDDLFREDQWKEAGIALQRGAFEAFKKALENL